MSGMPVPSPNVGMPAPVPPTAGVYGSAGPSMPQPGYPSGNLSFGVRISCWTYSLTELYIKCSSHVFFIFTSK